MIYRDWLIASANEKQSEELQKKYQIEALLADIIVGRDLYESAEELLHSTTEWPSPLLMKDMDKAVERIRKAIETGECVFIFGDYDADGITATALLYSYLESVEGNVYYRLPNRTEEGYGLSKSVIEEIHAMGGNLIITVDSGISSYEEVALAKSLGIDVVITDHHLPPAVLPEAVAVVDPMREDSAFPEKRLSGVGVAFHLICAIEECAPYEMMDYYADLVAIGTIADIMPLKGINRILVKHGLNLLQDTHRPGLELLLEQSGYAHKQIVTESISFGVAPRLNSAGRMGDATEALKLLLTDDYSEAQEISELLVEYNAERQQIEQEITKIAVEQIEADSKYLEEPILVVWGEAFHQGVIGIVASRIVEKYGKPTIVISIEGGEGKGSGRSVDNFSLYNAIVHCESLLIRYGGHDLAAGLSIDEKNLQNFRKKLNAYARQEWKTFVRRPICIDALVSIKEMEVEAVKSLDILSPFGSGNPQPLFLVKDAIIDGIYPVQEGKHTRIRLKQAEGCIYAIFFGTEEKNLPYKQNDVVDVVLSLSVFFGQAGETTSGRIKDIQPVGLGSLNIQSTWLYESFSIGASVTEEEKSVLRPTRGDIACVYKEASQNKYYLSDLRPLFDKLAGMPAGKILASVDILREIGVVEPEACTTLLKKVEVEKKQSLENSNILQRLK